MNPYVVRPITFSSGERFHLLIDKASGAPLFEPVLFVVGVARANGRANATIKQVLSAIMVLQLALDRLNIDIDDRLAQGRLLDLNEVEAVIGYCRREVSSIVGVPAQKQDIATQPKVVSLEKVRMRSAAKPAEEWVDSHTTGVRVRYIRDYLDWRAQKRVLTIGPLHPQYAGLCSIRELVKTGFTERVPAVFMKNEDELRQGLSKEALAQLKAVIEPTSPDNPWKRAATRVRNQLIIDWLLSFGLRNGELLGVRISNINFQANEVFVKRHADDVDDTRARDPNTKTFSRMLPMRDELVARTHKYITNERRAQGVARKNDWLFVANGTGHPLSLSAVNKLFDELRKKCPGLPKDLTPHILRHTWNDLFSDEMDAKKVPPEEEEKMRNLLMGWSPKSKSAAVYTRRTVREKSKAASLELQNSLQGPAINE